MCGRIVQASGPLRYQLVDGLDVPDSRLSNIPRRYSGAPSQDLLVIRQNHETGERSLDLLKWGLVPSRSGDPKGAPGPVTWLGLGLIDGLKTPSRAQPIRAQSCR